MTSYMFTNASPHSTDEVSFTFSDLGNAVWGTHVLRSRSRADRAAYALPGHADAEL